MQQSYVVFLVLVFTGKCLFCISCFFFLLGFLPSGSCAVAPAQLSGTDESIFPGSSCRLSCLQLLHDGFAHGCSELCLSTSQLWPSRSAGSCSQWEWAGLAPIIKFKFKHFLLKTNCKFKSKSHNSCLSTTDFLSPTGVHHSGSDFSNTLTFQGMLAFQHLQDSLRCCRMVLALFCLMPSGIMSKMSCITAARSSRSKWDSTRCLVTVLATPFEWRPVGVIEKSFA